jgi:glycosyltransferase involved in cell wall biosynthesis
MRAGESMFCTDVRRESSPRPLRVCRVVTTSLTARILLENQLGSLSEIDWTVVSGNAFRNPAEGISVAIIPMSRELSWSDALLFVRLFRYLKRKRFDIVQTHTPKASFVGLPAARLVGSFPIYSIHGARYFAEYGRISNLLGWCFERWCCTWAKTVLVQSREDETMLPHAHICSGRKVRYVGNGIVIHRFLSPVEPALDSHMPIVLMISRLVREKGVHDFIDLATRLKGRAEFVHIGWFDHDRNDAISEQEVASLNASGTVRFMGAVEDVRPYLASATVVVLPSYREGISRVSMEAAVMGRPLAGYNIRGVREVIDPRLGLLAQPGDVTALARIVDDLIRDPARCSELGERCRANVTERFSEDQVIERLRCLYAEIAQNMK